MQFNQKLYSSKLYNGFQFTVSALAVFSGSTYNLMKKHQETLTCFVAGTMILTASGLVAIENIKAGDKIYFKFHIINPTDLSLKDIFIYSIDEYEENE